MKNITRMMAGLTLALTLAACGGNPAPTPGSIELTATGVNASATVGSTTTGTFAFKNGGGSDLGYTVSVSYPTGKASGWLNFSGADASGTVKAGEAKSVTVNVTCQPYADTYAATLTLMSKDGAISKQLPVTLNCTAETNIPENAPVLSVKAEASAVSTDSAHITGTASDNVQVQRVTYKLNGGAETTLTGVTAAKTITLDFKVPGLAEGNNEIVVTAYDTSNNATPRTLAVTYTAPVKPPTDTKAPTLTVPADQLTNADHYTLSGSVSDEGGVKNVTYTVSKDGGPATAPATATLSGSGYSLDLSGLTDGLYAVTVTAQDNAGNQTAPQTVRLTVDRTAPSVSAGDVTVTDNVNGSAAVRVVAPDAASVSYSTDGATFQTVTGSSPFAFTVGTYTAGTHSVWVRATDAAGNVSAAVKYDFTIAPYGDLTAPVLTIQGVPLTNASSVNVTGTVNDASPVTVTYALSGQATGSGTVTVNADGTFRINLSSLTDGVYTLTVTARDSNGNSTEKTTTVTVDQTAPSLQAGDVTVTDNQNGSATVTVGGVGENTLWYSLDGVTWLQATGSTFNLPASGMLGAGNYTVWVKVGDAAGNVSAPVSRSFSIARYGDLTAPSLDLQATAAFNAGSVSVTGTVSDASPVTVTYTLSGQATGSGTVPVNGDGTFGLDLSNLAEGSYTLTVTASDDNGNSTEKTATFTADRTAPEAGADQSDTEWRNTPFTAHFTATDALSGLSDAADADFDLTVSADAPNSTEPVQVTRVITDNVGNTRTVTASARIDTVAPTITATADRAPEWSGWYKDSVTVTFACDDALSGVADCSAPQTLKASGQAQGTVRDRAGNSSAASLDVNVDADAPTFSSDLSASVVTVDGGSDALITGIIGDPSTQVQSLTYALNGAQPVDAAITPAASLALNLTVPNLQDGPNSIVLTATDALGHTSTKTLTVTAADTGAPTFTRVSIELVDPATTRTTLRLTGEVTDLVGVTRVTSSLNGGPETDLTITASQTVTFDQTLSGLIAGQNTLTVRAYDAAGNLEMQSQSFDVTANDYLAPTISNLRAVGKGRSSNVGITASITDLAPVGAVAGVRKVTLEYTENGVVKRRDVTGSLTGTSFSYTTKTLMVGMQIKLIVEDNAGNTITSLTTILRR